MDRDESRSRLRAHSEKFTVGEADEVAQAYLFVIQEDWPYGGAGKKDVVVH